MPILNLEALVASSSSLASALRGVERAANSDSPILIVGEAGTGRSLLAQLIHRQSSQAGGPLVEVDLATIPGDLFESELFGYRSGSFTGAEVDSPGRVGRAGGGTLVLDHLVEIPLASQPKLLRLVAEKRFSPLGGPEQSADVRIVSIGETDLPQRVAEGHFREDLFYRLEVLTFHLPPLRQRRGDLPDVTERLLEDLCDRMGRPRAWVSGASMEWMQEYSWPGNLRQLRNLLERALVLPGSLELDLAAPTDREGMPRTLAAVERQEIEKALRHTRGHQGKAAELLGISRKTLWEKRRRYDLP